MSVIVLLLAGSLLLLLGFQVASNEIFLNWFRRYELPRRGNDELPKAAIVLSLRGADESLHQCLDRLAQQDYPNYEIHVVLDHTTDPAAEIVAQWRQRHPAQPVVVHVLHDISPRSYLKASAVRQCIQAFSPEIGAALIVDADAVVYRQWMRDMISPLVGGDAGLVTGNRWYDPTDPSWGSRVRFIFNAWCVPTMYFMRATWGGCLACRRDVFEQASFVERMWDTSSEDSALQDLTRRQGLRLELHPDAMILQRDGIALTPCFRFMFRQLIWTRLYHPHYPVIAAGTLLGFGVAVAAVLLGLFRGAQGSFAEAAALIGTVVGLIVVNVVWMDRLHRVIAERIERVQCITVPRMRWTSRLGLLVAVPFAFVAYVWAVLQATLARRVHWRGITYRIHPPYGIEMEGYRPLLESQTLARPIPLKATQEPPVESPA
ncbi:MAG: glycosyltransferase family 2 protein [Pirellulaceae bacterium]